MSLILWITLQIIVLVLTPVLKAAVVVIPSEEQSFESYQQNCAKENYICTNNLIKEKLVGSATPKYDQLIMDLDLQSPTFTADLAARIKDVVETEMVSMEQLDSLISILQRSEELLSVRQNKLLKAELTQLQEIVSRSPAAENFNYFIFKKPISALSTQRLNSFMLRPLIKEIDFKREVIDQQLLYFKSGHCSQSRLTDHGQAYFNGTSYIFSDEANCSWADSVTKAFTASSTETESKYKLSSRQKNILLWSTLAIGAGLFLSQYEIKIEY